jgi:hypothetical protein
VLGLHAALRKDQRLRIDRDVQRVQQRPPVACRRIKRELYTPAANLFVEIGDRILHRAVRVRDRRMVSRLDEGIGARS